jgi:hypothetical protein
MTSPVNIRKTPPIKPMDAFVIECALVNSLAGANAAV